MKLERLLRKERTRVQELLTTFNERLMKLDKAAVILNGSGHHKHRMSVASRAKMSKAQKARWAKEKKP